jgi:hypothetical protein
VRRWQFVWWGIGRGHFGWAVPYPAEGPNQGCIYSARYGFGLFELRRWAADRIKNPENRWSEPINIGIEPGRCKSFKAWLPAWLAVITWPSVYGPGGSARGGEEKK